MKPAPPIPIARRRTIARWAVPGTLAISAFALLVSCVTPGKAKNQEALVCPQCRMVEVRTAFAQPAGRYPSFLHGRRGVAAYPGTTYEHRCEGCQGVLMTFLREGKFEHKCSICKETPFTCPVIHPKTARL
jgi:hypothetical protein